jgi:malonate decarboxylase alpha subunit
LIGPLFARDPAKIRDENVLMARMAIAAVYEPYQVQRLKDSIGYATAAIELLLPTFAAQRGLKGRVARHFVLNPHPALSGEPLIFVEIALVEGLAQSMPPLL